MDLEKNYNLKERFNFFKKPQPKLPTKILFLEWFFIFAFFTTTMTVHNVFFTQPKQHYMQYNASLVEKIASIDFSSKKDLQNQFIDKTNITPDFIRYDSTDVMTVSIGLTENINNIPTKLNITFDEADPSVYKVTWEELPSSVAFHLEWELMQLKKNSKKAVLLDNPILKIVDDNKLTRSVEISMTNNTDPSGDTVVGAFSEPTKPTPAVSPANAPKSNKVDEKALKDVYKAIQETDKLSQQLTHSTQISPEQKELLNKAEKQMKDFLVKQQTEIDKAKKDYHSAY